MSAGRDPRGRIKSARRDPRGRTKNAGRDPRVRIERAGRDPRCNVVIVHYHLRVGGVTQAIFNHLLALATAGDRREVPRLALLCGAGGAPASARSAAVPVVEVEGLGYDSDGEVPSERLADRLRAALDRLACPPRRTLLHVHNHSLGKNVSLPGALRALAGDGYALLLQIHDFAEDFRPSEYQRLAAALDPAGAGLAGILYPQARHVHYAVLNRRDARILRSAGVAASRLHLLPNAVVGVPLAPRREARARLQARFGIPPRAPFVLYPGRGIRRKNLGEALLWSALAPPDHRFGFTLPPQSSIDLPSYRRWKALAAELGLPCTFELGEPAGLGLGESFAAADRILTTSVAEGFGMVYVEAALAGRPLVGRDLPEITSDFVAAGLRLPALGDRLWVPLRWIGRRSLIAAFAESFLDVLAAYGCPTPAPAALEAEIAPLLAGGRADFAHLDGPQQARLVGLVARSPARRRRLHALNPWLARALTDGTATVASNARVARRSFSPAATGRRLLSIYGRVAASPRDGELAPPPRGGAILAELLRPARFHPIRAER